MLNLYRIAIYCALPGVLIALLFKAYRNKSYRQRMGERFGFTRINPTHGGIWIHAVSVGEVNASIPLIEKMLKNWPERAITVTTMTTTGSDRVLKVLGSKVFHCFLPYDYPGAVRRFLSRTRPDLAIVMETEIWPNIIEYCYQTEIPIIYTNVRLSDRSWRGYKRFKKLLKPVLEKVTQFAVQSKPDAMRLIQLGAPETKVEITGSIKFDIELPPSMLEAGESIRRLIGWNRPVIIAASTHEGEELQVLEAFQRIQNEIADLLLVLVPRHPERFNGVAKLSVNQSLNTVLRSSMQAPLSTDTEVLVVDTMGELPIFIAAGDITFMAGSLVPIGGHNILEPAALSRPVVFGPHMFNFSEISEMFLQYGAGIQILNADELPDVMIRLLQDPELRDQYGKQGKKLVTQNRGALEKVMRVVELEIS